MVSVSETIAKYLAMPVHAHISPGTLAVAFAVGLVSWLVLAEEADLRRERALRG